jgi:hypothetical protein
MLDLVTDFAKVAVLLSSTTFIETKVLSMDRTAAAP